MLLVGAGLAALGLLVAAQWAAGTRPWLSLSQTKPNIVVILSDDEDVKIHASMRKTKALLEEEGTTFDNFFVTAPICCPSRASILRGQYPHNTQILGNHLPLGGFEKFRRQGHEESTIATWLDAVGYHTAFFGKYLNDYQPTRDGVPPGWDEWYGGGNDGYSGFAYHLNENGQIVWYGRRRKDFLTDVLRRKATAVIKEAAEADEPFFLYIAPYVPHSPAAFAPRHEDRFQRARLPRPPAFNEADVSDKPSPIRNLAPLDPARIEEMTGHHRDRLRSLKAVDGMVARIVKVLEETGVLDRTYIIYTSDNGFHMGEHRLLPQKATPYEEDIRVPMVVRGPGVPAGERIGAMALNIDLAPTLAEIAGARTPEFVDGRSLLPLFDDPDEPWRWSFLIEQRQSSLIEQDQAEWPYLRTFHAIRTADWIYVEYGNGERELYDLKRDPYQLNNLIEEAGPLFIEAMSSRLADLVSCVSSECRAIEDLPLESLELQSRLKSGGAAAAVTMALPRRPKQEQLMAARAGPG